MHPTIIFLIKLFLLYFCFADGICRVAPKCSEELCNLHAENFRRNIMPIWQRDILNFVGLGHIDAESTMLFVGWFEIISAILMFFPFAGYVGALLFFLLLGFTYADVVQGDMPSFSQIAMIVGSVCISLSKRKDKRTPHENDEKDSCKKK